VSMNRKVEQSLNKDERGCYEATLVGPDNHVYSPCVVTGNAFFKLILKNFLSKKHMDYSGKI
jgi:hypothetical protein